MKTRKFLYLSSGIINFLCGGFVALLGVLMLVLSSIIKQMFTESYELVDGFITELVATDASYSYLLDYSKEQAVDYVVRIVLIVCAVFIVWGALNILFGIFNIRLRNNHDVKFEGRPGKKILYVVLTWLVTGINLITSIATTVAVFLKVRGNKTETKLYTASDGNS